MKNIITVADIIKATLVTALCVITFYLGLNLGKESNDVACYAGYTAGFAIAGNALKAAEEMKAGNKAAFIRTADFMGKMKEEILANDLFPDTVREESSEIIDLVVSYNPDDINPSSK